MVRFAPIGDDAAGGAAGAVGEGEAAVGQLLGDNAAPEAVRLCLVSLNRAPVMAM